jgi:hypothetical protein
LIFGQLVAFLDSFWKCRKKYVRMLFIDFHFSLANIVTQYRQIRWVLYTKVHIFLNLRWVSTRKEWPTGHDFVNHRQANRRGNGLFDWRKCQRVLEKTVEQT